MRPAPLRHQYRRYGPSTARGGEVSASGGAAALSWLSDFGAALDDSSSNRSMSPGSGFSEARIACERELRAVEHATCRPEASKDRSCSKKPELGRTNKSQCEKKIFYVHK